VPPFQFSLSLPLFFCESRKLTAKATEERIFALHPTPDSAPSSQGGAVQADHPGTERQGRGRDSWGRGLALTPRPRPAPPLNSDARGCGL
jgi:hypothetical protein